MGKTAEEIAAEEAAAKAAAGEQDPPKPPEGGKTVEELRVELEQKNAALTAANREAAERRRELDKLKKAQQEKDDADLSELDKLKKENEQLRAENETIKKKSREVVTRSAFVAEASKAGAAHPEDVFRLADLSTIEVDDEGNVKGVPEVVKALVEAGRVPMSGKPKAPDLDGGAGSGDRSGKNTQLSAEEIEAAKKMGVPLEKYAARKAEQAKKD